jgi:hypothetical protein
LTECRRKTKSRFEEKLSPGVLDLVNFFQINNFSFFLKRCSEAREQYFFFETFRFAPRKNKSMKEFVRYSTTDVLYQLVNLVLETCLIFSKTLKLSKTFVLSFSSCSIHSNDERYDSPIPDYFSE